MAIKLVVVTLTITSVCWFNSMYVMWMIRWECLPSYQGILPAISPAACAGLDWDPTYASEFAHDMCVILENAFLHLNPYRHRATCSWLLNFEWPSMRGCTLCKFTHQNDGYSVVQLLWEHFFVFSFYFYHSKMFLGLINGDLWRGISLKSESELLVFSKPLGIIKTATVQFCNAWFKKL